MTTIRMIEFHRTLFCICGLATSTGQNQVVHFCSWLFLTVFKNRYELYMFSVVIEAKNDFYFDSNTYYYDIPQIWQKTPEILPNLWNFS